MAHDLVPGAKPGDRFEAVSSDGRVWVVSYERLADGHGLDHAAALALLDAIGLMDHRTLVRFRPTYWGVASLGIPRPPRWGVTIYPGDVLDATDLFSLLMGAVQPEAIIEFRASGPDAAGIIDRIHAWFANPAARGDV